MYRHIETIVSTRKVSIIKTQLHYAKLKNTFKEETFIFDLILPTCKNLKKKKCHQFSQTKEHHQTKYHMFLPE